jgi:hypothetical protein
MRLSALAALRRDREKFLPSMLIFYKENQRITYEVTVLLPTEQLPALTVRIDDKG